MEYSKAKFKVGDHVLIINRGSTGVSQFYHNREGVILEIVDLGVIDQGFTYQVEVGVNMSEPTTRFSNGGVSVSSLNHIQYFNENELDITIQERRDRRLKELGI